MRLCTNNPLLSDNIETKRLQEMRWLEKVRGVDVAPTGVRKECYVEAVLVVDVPVGYL